MTPVKGSPPPGFPPLSDTGRVGDRAMVQIELDRLRLVGDGKGRYDIHILAERGPDAKRPGAIYVKKRLCGFTLDSALGHLVELWPQREGLEIRSLEQLAAQVAEAKALVATFLRSVHNGMSIRCSVCGKFFSPRGEIAVDSSGSFLCPGCHGAVR